MLLVYLESFTAPQTKLLLQWRGAVDHWPRSYAHTEVYNEAIPTDWWMLFHRSALATQWLLLYSDHTRIVRTLFDEDDPVIIR